MPVSAADVRTRQARDPLEFRNSIHNRAPADLENGLCSEGKFAGGHVTSHGTGTGNTL